jgi:hypothetical protein
MTTGNTGRTVYFIKPVGLDGPIKIGCSSWPDTRLIDLAAWSPFPLELIGAVPGTYQDESFLHRCFSDIHSHREWFHSTPNLRAAITTIIAGGAVSAIKATHAPKGKIRPQRIRTSEQRQRFSYSSRIRWAQKKLRDLGEDSAWHVPKDVDAIIDRWGSYRGDRQAPTPAEFARLEEYLANPAAHSIHPGWRKPQLIALVAQAERLAS